MVNSAFPQPKQTNSSGNTQTLGLLLFFSRGKWMAISAVNLLWLADPHDLHITGYSLSKLEFMEPMLIRCEQQGLQLPSSDTRGLLRSRLPPPPPQAGLGRRHLDAFRHSFDTCFSLGKRGPSRRAQSTAAGRRQRNQTGNR